MNESLLPVRAREAYGLSRYGGHLRDRAETLLRRGYSTATVGQHLREWVDFVREYEEDGAELPTDVRHPEVVAYLDRRCARRRDGHRRVRTALRLLLHPEDEPARRLPPERGPTPALYEERVPSYLAFSRQHRGRRTSRAVERALREFFSWLEARGVDQIKALSPIFVRDFLASREHLSRATLADEASVLRGFLRYLAMQGMVSVGLPMAVESPRLYRMGRPPDVLDQETVERLLGAVDRTTALGKRDYAMLQLAARYGLRPCDIRDLCLEHIRWREQRLVLVQAKTQRPLELPLIGEVDDAIVDYLRNGRPECHAREVFLRHVPPIGPFVKSNNLWDVMQRAFRAARIEPPKGRRGLYLLRHSAATRMLGQGAPFDVISDVLGHASVETTRVYAQVDLAGLRSVALSTAEVRA